MPESRKRKTKDFTPPPAPGASAPKMTARWVVPAMIGLPVLGLIWLCVFYLAGQEVAFMRDLGGWNLAIGMGLITGGFLAATQWR